MGGYIVILGIVVVGVLMGIAMSFAWKFAANGQINPTVSFKKSEDMLDAEEKNR